MTVDIGTEPQTDLHSSLDLIQPLRTLHWAIITACFVLVILLINILLPIPDLNDFTGLAQICLLIKEKGLRYCVNPNWGFAHPLVIYLSAKLLGNLLAAQRLVGAAFGFLFLVVQERLMRTLFPVPSARTRTIVLLAMLIGSGMFEMLLSLHLDIIPATLTASAVALLWSKRESSYLLAGFTVGCGSWFRFHYAGIAILFLLLLLVYNPHRLRKQRFGLALIGSAGALIVPGLFAKLALGTPPPSNGMMVLAEFLDKAAWTVRYELAFENSSMHELLANVDWGAVISRHFSQMLPRPLLVLIVLILAIHLGTSLRKGRYFSNPGLVAAFYAASILPLIFLRGFTLRMEATLLLLCAPYLAWLFVERASYLVRGLIVAIVCFNALSINGYISILNLRTAYFDTLDAELRSALPKEVSLHSPQKVFSGIDTLYNSTDSLWLWNPAAFGGWPVRDLGIRETFGVVDLNQLDVCTYPPDIEYLVLRKFPAYDFEAYNARKVKELGKVQSLPDMYVVELDRRTCAMNHP